MAHVLLVEDDRDIRASVREILEEEGHHVTVAENGEQALAALATMARPAVILLDLMMPVMDGWKVLEALNHDVHLAAIPVVVTSAAADSKRLATASAVVRKPYALEQLLELVDRFCQNSKTSAA